MNKRVVQVSPAVDGSTTTLQDMTVLSRGTRGARTWIEPSIDAENARILSWGRGDRKERLQFLLKWGDWMPGSIDEVGHGELVPPEANHGRGLDVR